MSRALAIAWAASALFLSVGCASLFGSGGRSAYIKERFGGRAANDLEKSAGEVRALGAAYIAKEAPRAWAALELRYSDAEDQARRAGKFTPEFSARLRQRYGEDARMLAGQIAEDNAKWELLASKLDAGADNIDALLLTDDMESAEFEKLRAFQGQQSLRVIEHVGVTAAEINARRAAAAAAKPKPTGNEHAEDGGLVDEPNPPPITDETPEP